MPGSGIKAFANGDILTSADVNNYLMDQAVCVFANEAARDAAFAGVGPPDLSAGRVCFIVATNQLQFYNGTTSAWVNASAQLTPNQVIEANIADNAVTTNKIANSAVTTAKIANGAVTAEKLGPTTIEEVSGTSYTLALADVSKTKRFTSSSAVTVTIPVDTSVDFAVGSEIYFLQYGTGQVSFSPSTTVTLNSDDGRRKIKTRYSSASLLLVAQNEWVLTGNLAA